MPNRHTHKNRRQSFHRHRLIMRDSAVGWMTGSGQSEAANHWDRHLLKALRSLTVKGVNEIVFEITQDADGGFCAECLTESIFTQGDSWDELRANVKEAAEAFYFDRP